MNLLESMRAKRHYGWAIFALTILNLTIEGGTRNSEAVFFVALRDSFGRSAAATAAVFSLAGIVGALASPVLGRALDRLGPRFLFSTAALLLVVGWLTSSLVTNLWQLFFTYSVVATLGQNAVGSFAATATLTPWFPRNRGRVLGLADIGNPLGQGIFAPLSQALISTLGWRGAYRIVGLLFFLIIGPANFLFQRRPPGQVVAASGGTGPAPQVTTEATGTAAGVPTAREGDDRRPAPAPLREILRAPALWLLLLTRSLSTIGGHMTRIHLVAFFVLAGYSELEAAATIGLVGVLSIGGRPLTGALSDSWGRERTFTLGMSMHVAAILLVLLLGNGESFWPLLLFVGLAGLSDGISGLVIGAKAADLFPSRDLGTAMGIVEVGRGVGFAVGPVLGGLLFDLQGSYFSTFTVAAGLILASVCCIWAVGIGGRR